MNSKRFIVNLALVCSLMAAGCSSAPVQATATPVPLPTDTATVIPTSTLTPTPVPTNTVTPTPNDGRYRPPQGNYACDFSSKTESGGATRFRVKEYYRPDSFETVLSNDFGEWYSIEFLRIADGSLPIPESAEERKPYLDKDLAALMERRIALEVPEGRLVEQEYLQEDTPILFAVLELPGGSNMTANGQPMDATRVVYIVIHGAYGYAISTQFTDAFSTSRSRGEILQQLKQDLADFYKTCTFDDNPEVGRGFVPPTMTPIPDPNTFIPDMEIPDELFFADQGSENFDPVINGVVLTKGDWILYHNALESILPVPKGWTTIETGQATYILFSPTDDPTENPAIQIKLGYYGYEDDSTTSEEPITLIVESVEQEPDITLLKQEIIDEDKGYVFIQALTEAGTTRYVLQVLSKYADNPSGKFFHVMTVAADEQDWEQYYPIVQAMLNNWHAYDGASIAVPLPDILLP